MLEENEKPRVGAKITELTLKTVDGDRTVTVGQAQDRWTVLFIYRGRHCPRCKKYLNKLNAMLADWQALADVFVTSADTREKARDDQQEFGWDFELCYGLSVPEMRALGLYVSNPLSPSETSAPFAEPGMFALRPDGTLMLVDISNGPAARPDLEELLDGMAFNINNDRPVRGMA